MIGAGAGGALAVAGYRFTRGESDAVYGWAYVGSWLAPVAGAVVGALVDRSAGPALVYRSSTRVSKTTVLVSPLLTAKGGGASIAVAF